MPKEDEFAKYKRKGSSEPDEFAQYKRLPTKAPAANVGTIRSAPTGAKAWLNSLEGDVRTGSGFTTPGRILQKLGAEGLNTGAQAKAGDVIGSPILGPIHAAQGVAETPEHPVRGPLKTVGGILETLTLPSSFVAPEAAGKLPNLLPGTEKAIASFREVMSAAKDIPINVQGPGKVALEIDKLAQAGGSRPKVITDFIRRVTDPKRAPITYAEARNFYENATRLSVDEMNRLTPHVKKLVGEFTHELGEANKAAAGSVGKAQQYESAMLQYYRAMRFQRQLEALKKYAIKAIPYAAGAYATEKVIRDRR